MFQRPSPKIPANSMIPGGRGEGGTSTNWLIDMKSWRFQPISRSIFGRGPDGASPSLHKIRSLSANCAAGVLTFRPPLFAHCPTPIFVLNFARHGRPAFTTQVRIDSRGRAGDPPRGHARAPGR